MLSCYCTFYTMVAQVTHIIYNMSKLSFTLIGRYFSWGKSGAGHFVLTAVISPEHHRL